MPKSPKVKRLPTLQNIKHAIQNKSGSEAIEMVYSTIFLMFLILATLMIIGYALQVNQVSYAAKRVARYVEVSGQANPTDLNVLLKELLPNASKLNAKVTVENTNYVQNTADGVSYAIQLREGFTVKVTADYEVTLANPANGEGLHFPLPIRAVVNGQSEIYWKTR